MPKTVKTEKSHTATESPIDELVTPEPVVEALLTDIAAVEAPELTPEQIEAINKSFKDRDLVHCGRLIQAIHDKTNCDVAGLQSEDLYAIMQELKLGWVAWQFATPPTPVKVHPLA